MSVGEIIATVLISGGTGAFARQVVDWIRHKKKDEADVTDQLSESAMRLVNLAYESARQQVELSRLAAESARLEATEARNEAAAARNEATQARREAMFAVATMRSRDLAILSPYATLESLREMVQTGPNGWGGASVHQA